MDDQATLLARAVAMAAAAWFRHLSDVEAYRRLANAVDAWNAYCAPTLEPPVELLDDLAEVNPPEPLGKGVADLERKLRVSPLLLESVRAEPVRAIALTKHEVGLPLRFLQRAEKFVHAYTEDRAAWSRMDNSIS